MLKGSSENILQIVYDVPNLGAKNKTSFTFSYFIYFIEKKIDYNFNFEFKIYLLSTNKS